jgi:hypothetical protein
MTYKLTHCTLALGVVLGLSACGSDEREPELVPVSGTVTLDGKPAEGVTVGFVPQEGTAGTGAYGSTDASGEYTLSHKNGKPGVEVGQYRVTFSKMRQADGSPIPEGAQSAQLDIKQFMPQRYTDPGTTPVKADVPAGGSESLDFQLSSR